MRPGLAPWLQNFIWAGEWSEWRDSNPRPSGPKPDALPGCATLRRRRLYGFEEVNQAHIEP